MDVQTLNPIELRKMGIEALSKALGPKGMVRFLQQFETGVGDYTKEKGQWLRGLDTKTIADEIKNNRKKK